MSSLTVRSLDHSNIRGPNKMKDNRAVSPVIGVILMVAITVILAAVIGTFVLTLGESTESAPQATLSLETGDGDGEIVLLHQGGNELDLDNIDFVLDSDSLGSSEYLASTGQSGVLSAGGSESVTLNKMTEVEDGDDTDGGEYKGEEISLTLVHEPSNSVIYSGSVTTGETGE